MAALLSTAAFVPTSTAGETTAPSVSLSPPALSCAGAVDVAFIPPAEFSTWNATPTRSARFTGSIVVAGPALDCGPNITGFFAQPDGKIIVAGGISSQLSYKAHRILRLNPDGGIDPDFRFPFSGEGAIEAAIMTEGGKIVAAGWFEAPEYTYRGVFRLNSDGGLDPSFEAESLFPGSITALTALPDGKLIAGYYDHFEFGAWLGGMVRLSGDGATDAAFSAPPGVVPHFSILRQADGKLLIDGLVRLESNGAMDPTFQPGPPANFVATAALLQPDGKVLLAGGMLSTWDYPYESVSPAVVRLNTDGSLDSSFRCDSRVGLRPDIQVCGETVSPRALAIQPNGQILLAGVFSHFNGEHRPAVVRLNSDGTVDPSFTASISEYISCDAGTVDGLSALIVLNDAQLLVAGRFSLINGVPRALVARLRLNDTACPGVVALERDEYLIGEASGRIEIKVQRAGDISLPASVAWRATVPENTGWPARAGVDFWPSNGVVTFAAGESARPITIEIFNNAQIQANRALLVQLDSMPGEPVISAPAQARVVIVDDEAPGLPGSVDASFQWPFPNSGASALAVADDGSIVVAAEEPLPEPRFFRVARLFPNGAVQAMLSPAITGACHAITLDRSNGSVIVAGHFFEVAGLPHTNIFRVDPSGAIDHTFNTQAGSNFAAIHAVLLLANGELVIGGAFSTVNGTERSSLARLRSDGSLDETFHPRPMTEYWDAWRPGTVNSVCRQDDNKLLIAGRFDSVDGIYATNVARLNPDGSVDLTFEPPRAVWYDKAHVLVQPDQKIVLSGGLLDWDGVEWRPLLRLNPDGSRDPTFALNMPRIIGDGIALQADGKILVAGAARFLADGTVDGSFFAGDMPYVPNRVQMTLLAPDGTLLVGGRFTSWNNLPARGMVKLRVGDAQGSGRVDFAVVEIKATEAGGTIPVPVRRSGDAAGAVTASICTRNGTAAAGSDYTSVVQSVTFAAGETGVRNVLIPIIDDVVARPDRSFSIIITDVTGGAMLGPNNSCAVEISDDETGVGFPEDTILVTEDWGVVYLQVRRYGATNGPITVHLETSGGTAIPNVDYVPISIDINIPAYAPYGCGNLYLADNAVPGPDQTIGLVLSDPVGAQLIGGPATIRVHDIEREPRITQMGYSQSGRFCVGLDVPPYTGGLLQASTNFINWVDVSWFYRDLREPPLLLEDTTTPRLSQRFYRLKQAPR